MSFSSYCFLCEKRHRCSTECKKYWDVTDDNTLITFDVNIKAIHCSKKNIKNIYGLQKNSMIKDLTICRTGLLTLAGRNGKKILPDELEVLFCNNNKIKNINNILPTGLKRLRINNNFINSLGKKLPENMSVLLCNNNKITSLRGPGGINILHKNLRRFECSENQLTSCYQLIYLLNCWHNNQNGYKHPCYWDNPINLPNRLFAILYQSNHYPILNFMSDFILKIKYEEHLKMWSVDYIF